MKNLFILAIPFIVLFSCKSSNNHNTNSNKEEESLSISSHVPVVIAANYPLYYFAKRIAGENLDIRFPEIEGDPAFWKPQETDVALLQGAEIILTNGADYSKWLNEISLPSGRLINTSASFSKSYIVTHGKAHSHGSGEEHSHGEIAFTTWLDFKNASLQAQAILDAFTTLKPEEKAVFQYNFELLRKDLEALDTDMQSAASLYENQALLGSHPVYQYLSHGYNLMIKSFHFEPGSPISDHDIDHIKAVVQKNGAQTMLWEDRPLEESVAQLRELGVNSIVFNPCGNVPEVGDWLSVMKSNITELAKK